MPDIALLDMLQVGDWFMWTEDDTVAWKFTGIRHVGRHPKFGELVEVLAVDADRLPASFTSPRDTLVYRCSAPLIAWEQDYDYVG